MVSWLLRGEAETAAWFTGDGPKAAGVSDVKYKNLTGIKVTPIQ